LTYNDSKARGKLCRPTSSSRTWPRGLDSQLRGLGAGGEVGCLGGEEV
jgi:hypothetical protein